MNKLKTFLFISILFSCGHSEKNPAYETLNRVLGDNAASKFVLSEVENQGVDDWFEIKVVSNKIHIKGNSPVSLCKGAYSYIFENNFGIVSWEGSNIKIPAQLKDSTYNRVTSTVPLRMYLNPCTYGYTMAWWDWDRWEKELDWMAIHGINMPLALAGQEVIWQQVWEEMGIESSELKDFHSGPAFLPWFRMGNIYNHMGPLPQSWIKKEKVLQKKIMSRMKELGMRPIVPAFSGHVPPYFKQLFPDSKIYELKDWGGLEAEKASYLLDPKDSLFSVIGEKFLKKYEQTYGKADLFLADSFNEMLPPVSKENKNSELAEYGVAIYKGIKRHNPEATWVLQGWTFGHQSYFWTPESTKAFFSKVPKDNLLILNYAEDRHALWEKLDAFYGHKWTYGYVHNYGGQQSLFGDINFYHDEYHKLINSQKKGNLIGYGSLPEAIENNSIVYEYIFNVPWGGANKPVKEWLNNYVLNRYGEITPEIEKAWQIALANTYSIKSWYLKNNNLGYGTYIHNNRPTLNVNSGDYTGNPDSIRTVLKLLIEAYKNNSKSALLYYDIIDFAQHFTAYKADFHLVSAVELYKKSDYLNGDIAFNKTKDYLKSLEVLQVATGGSFTKWCEDAVSHASNEEEKQLYLRNAKTQVTIWGGNRLKDYASKSWSGLLTEFYVPRWQMLFDDIKKDKENFDKVTTINKIIKWEEKWTLANNIPISPQMLTKDENIDLIRDIIE